jgi:hypothetical protein
MAILRRKNTPPSEDATPVDPTAPAGVRAGGPFDASEKDVDGESGYVDLGALKVRGRVGFEIRMQADPGSDDVGAVVLVTEDAALELRAFASSRSGGLWDEVRAELVAEVERLEGSYDLVDGEFGPELRLRIPVTLDDGSQGFQPSRIVVVEGPRWMLRGTFLGRAGLEPDDEGLLYRAFHEVVVERGAEAMASREPLTLTLPDNAITVDPSADTSAE